MLIDTHAHIYSDEFADDIDEVMQHAYTNDIKKIVLPNIDSASIKRVNDLTDAYPHLVYPLMGLHPTSVSADYKEELQAIEYWLEKRKFYGIGEIGIDLYWDKTYIREQEDAFRFQIKLARSKKLPVVIHTRESFNEVYSILASEQDGDLRGIFHCFSGNEVEAKKAIDIGFLLGIGGIITFKNNKVAADMSNISIENLVLETDSPYLAPEPKRGRRNESAYLVYIAQKVAEIYNISVEEVAEITTHNARNLFGI